MKLINQTELSAQFSNIYSFLATFDRKWLKTYFITEEDFIDFLQDDDLHIFAYRNEQNELCCVGIISENSVLTTAFSNDADNEESYSIFINDAELFLKDSHYMWIYFGSGYYSYGVYVKENNSPFADFLEKNGFTLENTAYDIKHKVSSMSPYNEHEGRKVLKTDFDTFKRTEAANRSVPQADSISANSISSDSISKDLISKDFIRFPEDTCYAVIDTEKKELLSYAFLNPVSYVIDAFITNIKRASSYIDSKKQLFSAIAADLRAKGIDYFIEANVDQLDAQKIKTDFEVCGKYKTLVKKLL